MNDDRITYQQLSQLTGSRDKRAAHAVENAVRGVSAAERTIRQTAAMIRLKLEERLGTRPPAPELHAGFTWVCEVTGARDRFVRGDRVALEFTGDPHTRLRPGDEGTVTRYDPGPGQLDVRWDSGSTLSMLLHDGDRVRLITPAPGAGTGETGKEPGR